MRRRVSLVIAASAASLTIPVIASPAAAYEAASSCYSQQPGGVVIPDGGRAIGSWNWASATSLTSVHLEAKDLRADGYSSAVRLMTKQRDGSTRAWTWRKNTQGSGTTKAWDTSAADHEGIEYAWVQGGLFNGSTLIGYCNGPSRSNPD
ncbi:hypothetical protein ACIHCM_03925 [Streptomyces sp. NPDC052023]|uniref:hypothetical protein n=1 Tax=Streptomyces sp. NPDC052023 TaxID=3365681 RepID=UPI0037CD89C4